MENYRMNLRRPDPAVNRSYLAEHKVLLTDEENKKLTELAALRSIPSDRFVDTIVHDYLRDANENAR